MDIPDQIVNIINLSLYYGKTKALKEITLDVSKNKITSFIGPSGCGKSTLIRCINRMNDLIEDVKIEGDDQNRRSRHLCAGRRRYGTKKEGGHGIPETESLSQIHL